MEKHYTFRTYKGTEDYKPKNSDETKTLYVFENSDGTVYKSTHKNINLPELKPGMRYIFYYDHWESRRNGWRQFDRLVDIKPLNNDTLKDALGDVRKA